MKIKFSHRYSKLLSYGEYIYRAKLLEVIIVNLEDLSKCFIDYDTDNGVYQLPHSGKYMMLIFQKHRMPHLFTTILRWTNKKELYYRSKIGRVFDIEFTQEQNNTV